MKCADLTVSDVHKSVTLLDPTTDASVSGRIWRLEHSADGAVVTVWLSRVATPELAEETLTGPLRVGIDSVVTEHELAATEEIDVYDETARHS